MKTNHSLLIGFLSPPVHGLTRAFELLLRGFDEAGLSYFVVNLNPQSPERQIGKFDVRRVFEILIALFRVAIKLPLVQRVYLIVAFSKVGFLRDFVIIWLSKLIGRRIVLHVHTGGYGDFYQSQPKFLQKLIQATLNQADCIILLSGVFVPQFEFVTNPNVKIEVVYNGIEFGEADSQKPKTISDKLSLLYLSNMIDTKGYLDCLQACKLLDNTGVPFEMHFCGQFMAHTFNQNEWVDEDTAIAHFQHLIADMGLQDKVHYHGVVRGEEKRQVLSDANLFLLPTYYPWEGQPISVIEALANATPVIATQYRGLTEQVVDGYNGFFVKPQSPSDIAAVIEKIWHSKSAYSELSFHAWEHFEKHFSASSHLAKIIPLIMGPA